MKKLWLIIQREYLTRVKRRSFILTTLLTPLGFALFMVVVSFIFGYENDDAKRIAIIDQAEMLENRIKDEKNLYFKFENRSLAELKAAYDDSDYQGILVIPPVTNVKERNHDIYFYSEDQLGLDLQLAIESKVSSAIRDYKAKELKSYLFFFDIVVQNGGIRESTRQKYLAEVNQTPSMSENDRMNHHNE